MKVVLLVSALLSLARAASQPRGLDSALGISPNPGLAAIVLPNCLCSIPRCPAEEPFRCLCLQAAALKCYVQAVAEGRKCPKPVPIKCPPIIPTRTLTPILPTPEPSCMCEPKACPLLYPNSCYCLNQIELECFDKCGGPTPSARPCPPIETAIIEPSPPSTLPPLPSPTSKCPCQPMACLQAWPASCYCANEQRKKCYDTCGGPKPVYQDCNATVIQPTGTHQRCGGLVVSPVPCPTNHICIDNPLEPGCGMACDRPGICVQDKPCGGFPGTPCPTGMACVDDPRDKCNPKKGGADCIGLCVWPPRSVASGPV